MGVAVILYVIGRWAKGEPAIDVGSVVGGIFAIMVIAMMDQGETEPIAKGFAWLFLLGAAYNATGPITKAAKSKQKIPAKKVKKA